MKINLDLYPPKSQDNIGNNRSLFHNDETQLLPPYSVARIEPKAID